MASKCREYAGPDECREEFDAKVNQWIVDSWLQEYEHNIHGQANDVEPLMAEKPPKKLKKSHQ